MESIEQDSVIPFYFGPQQRALFGAYHVPLASQQRDLGVLICNPWGQEAVRAHRSLFQLGLRLARTGFPVLRFDYFGTGDSAGDDAEGTLEQWQNDLRSAIQELKRRARVEAVYLVGLRLGASLAALVASGRDDVDGVVLWEPAVIGNEYVQDLAEWQREKLYYFLNEATVAQDHSELLGYGLHESLLADLAALDLLTLRRKPAGQVLLVEGTSEGEEARATLPLLCQHLEKLGARVDSRRISSIKLWTENPDKALIPQAILEAIVSWLAQEPQ